VCSEALASTVGISRGSESGIVVVVAGLSYVCTGGPKDARQPYVFDRQGNHSIVTAITGPNNRMTRTSDNYCISISSKVIPGVPCYTRSSPKSNRA
jgi:hypothetical protein